MRPHLTVSVLALGAAALPLTAFADAATLKLLPSGAMARVGGYVPQRLTLAADRPAALKKAPETKAPLYGELKLGPADKPTSFLILVDEPEGSDAKLYVDANGNGDLTDDPAAQWTKRAYKGRGGEDFAQYQGTASVALPGAGPVSLGVYRFDKRDPLRAQLKDTLLYYGDYAREGEVKLGAKSYKVLLHDRMATGDFRGKLTERGSGVMFLIDVNSNGRFDARGEAYDISKPFNIDGTTYEIKNVVASGATLEIVKSAQTVEQILPPPDLGVGNKALAFETKTTDGKAISFPNSYKGKLVLLDFWATWCGPCIRELPHLTAAYEKFHAQGLEVLGISLDQANAEQKLASFTKEHKMPWAQVYDGKFWQAAVAQKYGVDSIPRAYLVDGDTGEIVASGQSLRGAQLEATIQKALAGRAKP